MNIKTNNIVLSAFNILLIILSASACSSTAEKPQETIYYPALPNAPRIQFLTSFSTDRDLTGKDSGFSNFVLGEDVKKDSLISKPYGVAFYKNKLYVVDIRGPGYAVFDFNKNKTYTINGSGNGRIKKPINIDIDQQGSIFITDTARNQILQFDEQDNFVRTFGNGKEFKPSDVAASTDKLFVSDVKNHKIHVLDKSSGKILYSFGKSGSKKGELLYPTNLELASDGFLYISDTGNSRIYKTTQAGKFLQHYGQVGSGLGQFARPKGVTVDEKGRIYVVDAAFENIQVFNPDGKLLLFFGGKESAADRLILPADIEIVSSNFEYFTRYADADFKVEHILLVSNQFGTNKVHIYAYGKKAGMEYKN